MIKSASRNPSLAIIFFRQNMDMIPDSKPPHSYVVVSTADDQSPRTLPEPPHQIDLSLHNPSQSTMRPETSILLIATPRRLGEAETEAGEGAESGVFESESVGKLLIL
ncbi:hypothetical protein AKJ16_DCAP06184, partial [Drosera capensis]